MQTELNLNVRTQQEETTVEGYQFEPIKGYPMLQWQGKRPFTRTQFYPAQLKESYGEETDGWMNQIFWGDNLQVMSHLLKKFRGQVDLIYIDPPFDSKADYKKKIQLRSKSITNDATAFEEKQYTDIWTNDEYLQFIYERLVLARELLTPNGIVAVHCDYKKGHFIRCIMDEIFGGENFVNDLTWYYENKPQFGFMMHLPHDHDFIYVYTKNFGEHTLNHQQVPVKEVQQQAIVAWDPILKKRIAKRDNEGNIIYETRTEKYMGSVWTLPLIHPIAKERTGYPTQKPETILERIIKIYSRESAIVFDCFMGSGTTQAVAMKLGRRFLGADINLGAIQTTTKRLVKVAQELNGKLPDSNVYTGFQVYNVNHYDVFRNPVEAKELLMKALEIEPAPGSSLWDGEKDGRMVKVMPVNRIATRADLNEILANIDLRSFEDRKIASPNRPVELITLVCMGHEPDLGARLKNEIKTMGYLVDVEVVDVLRDRSKLEFKRDAEAVVTIENNQLLIREFYPMNLLQKLSLQKEDAGSWKELVESVLIDWNYDGSVLEPAIMDIPDGNNLVRGTYPVPANHGTIRVKITDVLSESLELIVATF